jgi:hypothetical protein
VTERAGGSRHHERPGEPAWPRPHGAVQPAYGLGDYKVVESSTAAMLAELDRSVKNNQPVAVTLWKPHWAYTKFPIKPLADPQNAFGSAEKIHMLGRQGFAKDFPEVHDERRAAVPARGPGDEQVQGQGGQRRRRVGEAEPRGGQEADRLTLTPRTGIRCAECLNGCGEGNSRRKGWLTRSQRR